MTEPRRSPAFKLLLAAIVALTGLVWLAQGLGVPIGGSFMVGDPFWAVVGAALVVLGGVLAWRALRRT
ncbi:MAG: hypothetical protein FIA92_09200 [Chloroflexi bacterium]|nr:hypothetical protein [Chloroflexota bacterium]